MDAGNETVQKTTNFPQDFVICNYLLSRWLGSLYMALGLGACNHNALPRGDPGTQRGQCYKTADRYQLHLNMDGELGSLFF
jgi:hypothetical protein